MLRAVGYWRRVVAPLLLPSVLRALYAMSGTCIGDAPAGALRDRYPMSGTDLGHVVSTDMGHVARTGRGHVARTDRGHVTVLTEVTCGEQASQRGLSGLEASLAQVCLLPFMARFSRLYAAIYSV